MGLLLSDVLRKIDNNNNYKTELGLIVMNYAILTKKFENPNEQSWCFRKGIESNRNKIIQLKKDFDEMRGRINRKPMDYFINEKNKDSKEYKEICQKPVTSCVAAILRSSYVGRISYYAECIELKNRVGNIKYIKYYILNPDELVKLLGW